MSNSNSRTFGRGSENGFTQVHRHETTKDANKYIGKPNEITYDPCSHCLIIHNGCTAGGCDRICIAQEDVDNFLIDVAGLGIVNVAGIVSLKFAQIWAQFGLKKCDGSSLPMASTLATCADLHPPAHILGNSNGPDGIFIDADPVNQNWRIIFDPINAVASICANAVAKKNLASCVKSADANNDIVLGTDGLLFVPKVPDIHIQGFTYNQAAQTVSITETNGGVFTTSIAEILDTNVSANAGNIVVYGTDGGALLTAQATVDGIQADPTAFCDLVNTQTAAVIEPLVAVQNTQTGQVDLTPAPTENYGLRVNNSCRQYVPYAKFDEAGVIEIVDFASMEAKQDHNMGAGNLETTAGAMDSYFRLDNVRALTARSMLEVFKNNFWIESNRIYNVPSVRFPTINDIADYLADHRIAPNATVRVNLAAGKHTLTRNWIGHPDHNRIDYKGVFVAPPAQSALALTGNRNADYAANLALLTPAYPTIIDCAGFTITASSDLSQGSISNVDFRGILYSIHNSVFNLNNIFVNGKIADTRFYVQNSSKIDVTGNFTIIDDAASLYTGLYINNNSNITVVGNFTNIGSNIGVGAYFNSQFHVLGNTKIGNTPVIGVVVDKNSYANLNGGVDLGWGNIGISATNNSYVNYTTAPANSINIHNFVINEYASVASKIGVDRQGAQVIVKNTKAGAYGQYVDVSSTIDYFQTAAGSSVDTNTVYGYYVRNNSHISFGPNVAFSANGLNGFVSNDSSVMLNGAAAGAVSPPVGISGNFNSIIIP
jgi:hypothetical protein